MGGSILLRGKHITDISYPPLTQPEVGMGESILLQGKHITDISYPPPPTQPEVGVGVVFSYEVNTSLILVIPHLQPNQRWGWG